MSQSSLEFKLNIGDKQGKCHVKVVRDAQANALVGKKIGDIIDGSLIGLAGYEFMITGGTDRDGFPHRKNIEGPGRRKYLLSGGTGYRVKRKGKRVRKTVRGNTISEASYQINMKVVKEGERSVSELLSEKPSES